MEQITSSWIWDESHSAHVSVSSLIITHVSVSSLIINR
jgi:hypothetical protein